MACNDCPELIQNPNMGCLEDLNTECITYTGEDIPCADIFIGQSLNEIIENLANKDCALQEAIDNIEIFSCGNLSSCSISDLGDVNSNIPNIGDILVFDGISWINSSQNLFSCGDLSTCSINDLGDVNVSPSDGQILSWDESTNEWIATNPSISNIYTAINGISEFPSGVFRLGGDLVSNTIISGENFNFHLGTDISIIDLFSIKSNILDATANIISLNTTNSTTQNKGFRFDGGLKSISIGTEVFNDFSIDGACFRIGDNITLTNTLSTFPSEGTFIGQDIDIKDSGSSRNGAGVLGLGAGFGIGLGRKIDLDGFFGCAIGRDLKASSLIGGYMLGTAIELTGAGLGNQFAYIFGNNVNVAYSTFTPQSNLVFNPSSANMKSSAIGNSATEKIKTDDVTNKIITTFNSDEYYFFTNISNDDGWAINDDLCKITQKYIRVPKSFGIPSDAENGCIRYNPSTDKYQGYLESTSNWVDFH
jgi:hypothetical protein